MDDAGRPSREELDALRALAIGLARVPGVERAFIYGSWAARYRGEPGPPPADVDVLVVGTAHRDDLYDVAEEVEPGFGREVQIRGVRPETWENPPPENPFLAHVRARPLIELDLPHAQSPGVDEFARKQRIADLETLMRAAGLVPEAFTRAANELELKDVDGPPYGEGVMALLR